ncbi:cupredoxin domain-containing protein [Candidatus Pacearchaeota archaeon]|nr:cupredoxin domain-containing protein [Candidatus Pacearchaeota archaeon]
MSNNNGFFIFVIIFVIVVAGIFVFFRTNIASGISASKSYSNAQVVKLSVSGSSYILSPSTVKKGAPVRMEADMSKLPGCSKSIVIAAFNVRKVLSDKDNIIEFVPDKAGTFNIACSMNMYRGTFTVLDDSGKASTYIESANTKAGSCSSSSSSSGGCGCGG